MPTASFHTPVLLHEVLSFLITAPGGTYLDATLGGGGHAEALLDRLDASGRLIALDADQQALAAAGERLKRFARRALLVEERFGNLAQVLSGLNVPSLSGVLFDLGVSSFQLDEGSRGFSFRVDETLDMRMSRRQERDAVAVLGDLSVEQLTRIFREYGEEKHARRIANRIAEHRRQSPVRTSGELKTIIREAVGERFLTKSLARIFQALRIEVNDELTQLQQGMNQAIDALAPGGRIVVISYHSLEDRIVKQTFKAAAATTIPSHHRLLPDRPVNARLRILTKKPVEPSSRELKDNPRSRSAKLRAAERI